MIARLFLAISLVGAEWVLYLLILLSVISVSLIIERAWFYRKATRGLAEFRRKIRAEAGRGNWVEVKRAAFERITQRSGEVADLETGLVDLLVNPSENGKKSPLETLSELSQDVLIRARLGWEKNLNLLATIGSNAPFIGLFGTVLGIIRAFHDLAQQVETGAQTATAGISEALVATAIGLLVAIPAVISFNLFQRRIRTATAEAEALKSFLIGKLVE